MKSKSGFTIVELLVVIVVIAILAAITIISYNFVTSDARDSARRSAAKEVQKMTALLAQKKTIVSFANSSAGTLTADGVCPRLTTTFGGGWVASGSYPSGCTLGDMLVAAKMTTAQFWDTIPRNEEKFSYTKDSTQLAYDCGDKYVLFYYVKNATPEEVAYMDSLKSLSPACSSRVDTVRDTYGVRAAMELSI